MICLTISRARLAPGCSTCLLLGRICVAMAFGMQRLRRTPSVSLITSPASQPEPSKTVGARDKVILSTLLTSAPDLARLDLPFRDARLGVMLQRYRARNFRDTLNNQELTEWNQFRRDRLFSSEALASYEQSYAQAKAKAGDSKQDLFKSLDDYVAAITAVDAVAK